MPRARRAAALLWGSLLSASACATETTEPQADDSTGNVRNRAGASGAGGASTSPAGSSSGGMVSGGASGKAGAGGMAGATTAGAGGKPAGGASAGGAGGVSTGGGGSGNVAGTAGAGGKAGAGGSGGSGGKAGAGGSGGTGGGGNAMCDSGVAFCDDFEDNNANGWTKSGGTWRVVDDGGDRVYEGGAGSEESYAGSAAWTDQTVEANVKVVSFGGTSDSYRAGIVARFSGASSFYVFALGGDGNLTLRKSTSTPSGSSGTCGPLAADIDVGQWFTLKITVSGAASSVRIRTYLDGALKHDCMTTSSTVASGQAGLLTYGSSTVAHFDDVSVTTP